MTFFDLKTGFLTVNGLFDPKTGGFDLKTSPLDLAFYKTALLFYFKPIPPLLHTNLAHRDNLARKRLFLLRPLRPDVGFRLAILCQFQFILRPGARFTKRSKRHVQSQQFSQFCDFLRFFVENSGQNRLLKSVANF